MQNSDSGPDLKSGSSTTTDHRSAMANENDATTNGAHSPTLPLLLGMALLLLFTAWLSAERWWPRPTVLVYRAVPYNADFEPLVADSASGLAVNGVAVNNQAMFLPQSVTTSQGFPHLWLVDPEQRLQHLQVTVVGQHQQGLLVSGLKPGDLVVSETLTNPQAGQRVHPKDMHSDD